VAYAHRFGVQRGDRCLGPAISVVLPIKVGDRLTTSPVDDQARVEEQEWPALRSR